jgi:hypothetical protein
MKVTGFTFIRNALKYDYPVVEAITSILPLCDNFVVAVGKSEDSTLELIADINSKKIKIIETEWDDSLREGGRVLAVETDKAFQAVDADSDWAFYIQGDEVIHEKYLPVIREAMFRWKEDEQVDGLLFNYLHFYGSYDYVGTSPNWYAREIRVIKNNKNIYAYRDAQGFRKNKNEKLKVKPVDAAVYHYGWVKNPVVMQRKQEDFPKLWHDDTWVEKHVIKAEMFDYSGIDTLKKFEGTHPKVMLPRVKRQNWLFEYDMSYNRLSVKNKLKIFLKNRFGIELGYKNYIRV